MSMPIDFLLIGHPEDTNWSLILSQVLVPLGKLETISETDAVERIADYECDVIAIIDATVIEDVPALVSRLRDRCPQTRVVVATVSPTWQRARDAFKAGAVDYIRKSWDSEELLSAIREILSGSLPHEVETL
jgi:DNA-binding NarL/FixJ family response regulator